MFDVIIAGGARDGLIIGEFREFKEAEDMVKAIKECYGEREDIQPVIVDQEGDDFK